MHPSNRPTSEDKFWARVTRSGTCWTWNAGVTGCGYGQFYANGKNIRAHRWAYEHYVGPIPDGLVLDHLCRNRLCVNPEHLEPVTQRENVRRGNGIMANLADRSECKNGHPFSGPNLFIRPNGHRGCRQCHREKQAQYRSIRRAATPAAAKAAGAPKHKSHCPHGHPYDEVNTYINPKGERICRACRTAGEAARRARKRSGHA